MKKAITILLSAVMITSVFAGCAGSANPSSETTAPATASTAAETTAPTEATTVTLSQTDDATVDAGLKVDKNEKTTDKNCKEVKTENGKVEVKTEDGKTVKVDADDVKEANENKKTASSSNKNTSSNKSSSSKTSSSSSKKSSSSTSGNKTSNSSSNSNKSSSSSNKNSSGNKTNSGSTGKPSKPAQPVHRHNWVQHYTTKTIPEVSHYEDVKKYVCNGCGAQFDNAHDVGTHIMADFWDNCENYTYKVVDSHKVVDQAAQTVKVPDYQYCTGCGARR